MRLHDSLTALLSEARSRDRSIRFIDGDRDETVISFDELWRRAAGLLGVLQDRGMQPGDELVVFTRSNAAFVTGFWAALLGGIVPVPVAVGISDEHRLKLVRILRQMKRGTLLTSAELSERLREFAAQRRMPDVIALLGERTVLDSEAARATAEGIVKTARPDDLAFIQYSSGSTSEPKGVCLTHGNLTTNIRAIVEGTGWNESDNSLSWMPLTHDMGLIGYHLSVLAAGMDHAVMDTNLFVRRPLLWMSKASELRATQLCSPNFGYKHFLKLFERKGLDGLDLGSVRLILNGAEPISWDLCERFLAALAPFGLRRSAMFPVYGLAEATVAVSVPEPGREYSRIVAHRHGLRTGVPYRPAEPGDVDAVSFVKVGRAVRDCEIRVVDDEGLVVASGVVGNIQVRGGNVTHGLYRNPQAEAALFTADGWLRTGDCGTIADGELVITGRAKDLIIVNGQNYYPHDIESIVADVDDLDLGKVVVCGVNDERNDGELLVVFVLYRKALAEFRELEESVRSLVAGKAGLEVDHVVPVPRIPKTTSGKVQRAQLATDYLDGAYDDAMRELATLAASELPDERSEDPLVLELEKICREISKDRRIGPDDNLFEVGVSSLTLTEIVLAVDEKYPGKVDISDLFDYPTIRELSAFLRR